MAADAIIQGIEERRRIVVTPGWSADGVAQDRAQRLSERPGGSVIPEVEEPT